MNYFTQKNDITSHFTQKNDITSSHLHPISNFFTYTYYYKITYQTHLLSTLKQSSLSAWTNHKSVMGAVQVLSARLALLEPAHLDHIEGRLHAVHTRMNSISEKKAAIEDADKQSKVICELHL